MDDAAIAFQDPDPLKLALLDPEVLEQATAVAQEDRDQVDRELVEEPCADGTLCDARAVDQYLLVAGSPSGGEPKQTARAAASQESADGRGANASAHQEAEIPSQARKPASANRCSPDSGPPGRFAAPTPRIPQPIFQIIESTFQLVK